MKVERDITIKASPDQVWKVLMDPQKLADWVSIHQKLKDAPSGQLEEGDELTQCLRLMHKNFDVKWHVKQADKPHKAVWEGRPTEEWQRLAEEYQLSGVICPQDWQLKLPLVAEDHGLKLYSVLRSPPVLPAQAPGVAEREAKAS